MSYPKKVGRFDMNVQHHFKEEVKIIYNIK